MRYLLFLAVLFALLLVGCEGITPTGKGGELHDYIEYKEGGWDFRNALEYQDFTITALPVISGPELVSISSDPSCPFNVVQLKAGYEGDAHTIGISGLSKTPDALEEKYAATRATLKRLAKGACEEALEDIKKELAESISSYETECSSKEKNPNVQCFPATLVSDGSCPEPTCSGGGEGKSYKCVSGGTLTASVDCNAQGTFRGTEPEEPPEPPIPDPEPAPPPPTSGGDTGEDVPILPNIR